MMQFTMWHILFSVLFILIVDFVAGIHQLSNDICGNKTQRASSCTTQILGDPGANINKCDIQYYKSNSDECLAMKFGPINDNTYIGWVGLKPYLLPMSHLGTHSDTIVKRAVLNITFSNIKWQTMKFRFQNSKYRSDENHCRDIVLSKDVNVDDQSMLYYDCYWPIMDNIFNGQMHILDFEASYENVVNTGQYYFNIPSAKILNPTITEREWLPFLYVEILKDNIKLHIVNPPPKLLITGYEIKVMRDSDKGTDIEKASEIKIDDANEVTYNYNSYSNGTYYFIVTPRHEKCTEESWEDCQSIESPKIPINYSGKRLDICIASAMALVIAVIFAYYLALRLARRRWCGAGAKGVETKEAAAPGQCVLVVYPGTSLVHRDCVRALVAALRRRGLSVRWDGDAGARDDPFAWAVAAWAAAGAVLWVPGSAGSACGPGAEAAPTRHVDRLVLSLLRAGRGRRRVAAALFPHAAAAPLPPETRDGPACRLPKDWGKLLAALGVPKSAREPLSADHTGRTLLEDLERAERIFSKKNDNFAVVCEKDEMDDRKILI